MSLRTTPRLSPHRAQARRIPVEGCLRVVFVGGPSCGQETAAVTTAVTTVAATKDVRDVSL